MIHNEWVKRTSNFYTPQGVTCKSCLSSSHFYFYYWLNDWNRMYNFVHAWNKIGEFKCFFFFLKNSKFLDRPKNFWEVFFCHNYINFKHSHRFRKKKKKNHSYKLSRYLYRLKKQLKNYGLNMGGNPSSLGLISIWNLNPTTTGSGVFILS